jgi:hypothetical protein
VGAVTRERAERLRRIWLTVEKEALAYFAGASAGATFRTMERRPLPPYPLALPLPYPLANPDDELPVVAFQLDRQRAGLHDRPVWVVVAEGVVVSPWFEWPLCRLPSPEPARRLVVIDEVREVPDDVWEGMSRRDDLRAGADTADGANPSRGEG